MILKNKYIKRFIIFLIILSGYYYLSKFLSKNNQFIQYRNNYAFSLKEAKEKDFFIHELHLENCFTSSNIKLEDVLSIRVDKSVVSRSYGIIPIEFNLYRDTLRALDINFKDDDSKLRFTLNNSYKQRVYGMSAFTVKYEADHNIKIYDTDDKVLVDCNFNLSDR